MSKETLKLDLDNINQVADEFLLRTKGCKQFAFYGRMGAGKTTLITAVCEQLKALDLVSSPTFAIVNEYETEDDQLIYHFDFYRIKDSEELFDIGFEEYTASDNWCFIEWPERAEELIPESFIKVHIEVDDAGNRELSFSL